MATTKYARQLLSAQTLIKRKGVQVTWVKADNTNAADDASPEFPTQDKPKNFKVYMVFYTAKRQNLMTILANAMTGSFQSNNFAVMAGGLKFTPEDNDAVILPDGTVLHVNSMNITQPDLVPIVYELDFK